MIGKTLSRNEMKQTTGGSACAACINYCPYDPYDPSFGCQPGYSCVLRECNAWSWGCDDADRYHTVCVL
ncbi:hypothetical protein [Pedobacter sp. Hv1]|uniref:hypothetical protein n=1 Tax=Pedobacter sp. Hv1 TaxID=1740090 RepID=UPI000ADD6B68|nr:hypothetical protein [Pedobacter sp. Hv1]